jgi:predicted permease
VVWEKVKFLATKSVPYTGANPRHEFYWRDHNSVFSGICLVAVGTRGISFGVDHPHLVGSIRAQPNFLNILAVSPILGRNFIAEDAVQGHDQVVIITHSLWRSMFQSDPNVIGKTLRVADLPYQVIGVLPESFQFPKRSVLSSFPSKQGMATAPPVEIVTPLVIDPHNQFGWNSDYGNNLAIARLKPGISARQAEAQLNILQREIVDQMPASDRSTGRDPLLAYVQPLQNAIVDKSSRGLWMLMAAVIGVMLIACVNLANAQLGRAVSREREAGVRSALGAGTWQLMWSSLSETVLLAVLGGAAGIALAVSAIALLQRYAPVDLPRITEIHPNYAVLGFAIVLVLGSAFFFGTAPALHFMRTDPQRALQQNTSRVQGSRQSHRLRLTLIGIQVFGCTALLLLTGLFAKSLATMLSGNRGFDTSNVVAAEVYSRGRVYNEDAPRIALAEGILNRLRELPGAQFVALGSAMPLEGETWIEGINRADKHIDHPPLSNVRWVSDNYFKLLRERLVAGRFIEDRDRNSNVVVISEASARAAWPGEDPVGKQIRWRDQLFTIIGIVGDSRTNSLKDTPVNMMYFGYRALAPFPMIFMLRTKQAPNEIIPEVRRAIWDQDPELTISRVKTLDSQVKDSLAPERFQTFILVAFGISALLLAMLGIYGVLSYIVAGRTQEFGVRMALGATRESIYSLTMSEAAIPVLAGLITGWGASVVAGRFVERLLYGVAAVDWTVTLVVAGLLLTSALIAAFLPARRAAGIDPMQALRTE